MRLFAAPRVRHHWPRFLPSNLTLTKNGTAYSWTNGTERGADDNPRGSLSLPLKPRVMPPDYRLSASQLPSWLRDLDVLEELRQMEALAVQASYSGPLNAVVHFKEGRAKIHETSMKSVRKLASADDKVTDLTSRRSA